jgi:hypothetical protein
MVGSPDDFSCHFDVLGSRWRFAGAGDGRQISPFPAIYRETHSPESSERQPEEIGD